MSEQSDLHTMLNEENAPDYYFNGFAVGASKRDVIIFLSRNDKLQVRLNASHITVKELAKSLLESLEDISYDSPTES